MLTGKNAAFHEEKLKKNIFFVLNVTDSIKVLALQNMPPVQHGAIVNLEIIPRMYHVYRNNKGRIHYVFHWGSLCPDMDLLCSPDAPRIPLHSSPT